MPLPVVREFGAQIAAELFDGEDGVNPAQITIAPSLLLAVNLISFASIHDALPGARTMRGDMPLK